MLRIGYFGDGPWASRALERITSRDDMFSVAFITPRFDTQCPALKDWSEKLGIPFLVEKNVNDPAFIDKVAAYDCDLLVSMSFNQILKKDIIEAAPKGFINCHAGALPFYRGRNPLNWVLINGEKEFGVTVHYVDEGIDTGDIIVRNLVGIENDDDYGTLLEKAFLLCADALEEALVALESGKAKRVPQDTIDPVGFYCGRRRAGDEWIDWRQSSADIRNFIRGLAVPGPGAWAVIDKGKTVALLQAQMIEGAPSYKATAGEVVGRTENGVVIKTGDTTLLVTKAADLDDKQRALGEPYVPRWRIGTRLDCRSGE